MKTILDTIVEHKRVEVSRQKLRVPLNILREKQHFHRSPVDYRKYFKADKANIIAEFKRKSPSKGQISTVMDLVPVVEEYKDGGAFMSSVLTDGDFFGGSISDLARVKDKVIGFPLLRKDFIIDSYQVYEAKAYGADVILLIASVLQKAEVKELTILANQLGLGILLEVHTEEELEKWEPGISLVGVNNRNLKDFTVDINRSLELQPKLPREAIQISESGLQEARDVVTLFEAGYRAFLMGEHFMKAEAPGKALGRFIQELDQRNG